jgi:hypothetical protein
VGVSLLELVKREYLSIDCLACYSMTEACVGGGGEGMDVEVRHEIQLKVFQNISYKHG